MLTYIKRYDIYEIVFLDCLNNYKNAIFKDIKKDLIKVILKTNYQEQADRINKYINDRYTQLKSYVIKSKDHYLIKIISRNTDKSQAIKTVINLKNIDFKNIYTIGDGSNDIEMIRDYNGYAMINSQQELFNYTNNIVKSVKELIEKIK